MIPRSLPLATLFLLFLPALQAQKPTPVLFEGPLSPRSDQRAACNDAGTANVSLSGGSQSNSPLFLCFGDSLQIQHNGNQDLSGDPNPATAPGIGYGFYQCPPSISGMTLADILADPCIFDDPVPPTGLWITTGPTPSGNTTFYNDGFLQDFFNNGDPVQIWFAPITIDNFAGNTYEEATPGAGAGPCVSVRSDAAFPVVYLNPVTVSNLNVSPFGTSPGTGSFVIRGGRSQFDGTPYSVSIYQRSNPMVTATITSGPATHGSTVTFTVPNDREYVVEIEDGTGCSTLFYVTVPSVVIEMDCIEVEEGSVGCLNVRVRNYTLVESIQLFFHYDPSVVSFTSLTSPGLPSFQPAAGANVLGDSILAISHFVFPGETIPAEGILFTICYTAVGAIGDCSPLILKTRWDGAKNEAIIGLGGGADAQIGISSLDGCICIVESGDVKVNVSTTPVSCAGDTDGTLRIEVNGGTPPYQYQWAHAVNGLYQGSGILAFNPSTITIPNLIPGIYSVTVTDSEGVPNVVTRQVQLGAPAPIFINLDIQAPTCHTDSDGFLLAGVLGGTPPLNFVWSNGPNGIDLDFIDGLSNGSYSLTITDNNGCTQTASQTLLTSELTVSLTNLQNVSCAGGPNSGAISVQASGGTLNPGSAYQYTWSPGGAGPSLTNLPAGSYNLTVNDDNGCQAFLSADITAPSSPQINSLVVSDAGCSDKANGSIVAQVTPAPGSPIVTYAWSGPGGSTFSGAQINGLLPGNYFLTVTDVNGCAATGVAFVSTVFPFAVVDTFITLPTCPGQGNGSLGLQLIGGTTPYSFTWSNLGTPSPNSVNASIASGSYTVTITDAEGCGPAVLELFLPDPPAIVATFSGVDSVSCHQGICDGAATATAGYSNGGTGVFTYNWSSGELGLLVPSSSATMLCGGLQSVTISDGNCAMDTVILIPAPDPILVNPQVTDVSCFGLSDGSVTILVSGGSPAYQYVWAPGDTTTVNNRTGLSAGFFQITVVDQKGCLGVSSLTDLSQPDPFALQLDTDRTRNVRCAGEINGVLALTYSGGNPGTPTFQWSAGGASGPIAANLAAGTYSVTATDSRGCQDVLTHVIQSPPAIQFVIPEVSEPLCFGETTFLTVSQASGGNGPEFRFSVDNGPAQALNSNIAVFAGPDILVSVFDAQGCRRDTTLSVDQPLPLVLDLGPDLELELGDSVTLTPLNNLGGFTIISYLWNPTEGLDCSFCDRVTAAPERNTTYTLRIEDINGCSAEDRVSIAVRSIRRVYIPSAFSPNFDGFNDVFTIHAGKGVDQIVSVLIFDRWGNQLHEQTDLALPADGTVLGWDGHFRGRLMDPGTYVYAVTVRFLDGRELIYRGDVNILR
jgi:gliding motility-associated-like protein